MDIVKEKIEQLRPYLVFGNDKFLLREVEGVYEHIALYIGESVLEDKHEYVLQFARNAKYLYDIESIIKGYGESVAIILGNNGIDEKSITEKMASLRLELDRQKIQIIKDMVQYVRREKVNYAAG